MLFLSIHPLRHKAEDGDRRHEENKIVELVERVNSVYISSSGIAIAYSIARVRALLRLRSRLHEQTAEVWKVRRLHIQLAIA